MKRAILSLTIIVAFVFVAKGQKCTIYEKGQTLKSTYTSWAATVVFTPEWMKMKPAKKTEYVEEYNKKAEAGTEKPSYDGKFESIIKDDVTENGSELITMTTKMGEVEMNTYITCRNDTMFFVRGALFTVTKTGYNITGIQAIPNKLKVGDVLKEYVDMGETFPESKEWQDQATVFDGYKTKTETKEGTFLDSYDHQWKSGTYEHTSSVAVYKTVTVNIKQKASFSMLTRNYVNANVAREESVTIEGKQYNAFVIESQKWIKVGPQVSISSDVAEWQKSYDKVSKKIAKMANKEIMKMGFQNELGYIVAYVTEWFVPGIGIVKTIVYDNNGFLNAKSGWESLK